MATWMDVANIQLFLEADDAFEGGGGGRVGQDAGYRGI